MDYINSLLSKLTERQKNIILNIKPDFQITLSDYIKTVLVKHVDETGCVTLKGKKISLENYVKNIIYNNSSIIEKFIYRNGGEIDKLQEYLATDVCGTLKAKENDADYTLACRNDIYSNKELENICIKDIIGTLCEDNNLTILQMLESLYSGGNTYSSRNNNLLNNDINYNIDTIKKMTPIDVVMINDKYYIKNDGHHRVYYLLLCYLLEVSKSTTPEEIEQLNLKYTFSCNVSKKLDNEVLNMISYAMIKCNLDDLKVLFVDKQTGAIRIQLLDKVMDINNDNELINEIGNYLYETYNPNLITVLSYIGFFEKTSIVFENESFQRKGI